MKSILSTILIVIAGLLSGCSSTSSAIIKTTSWTSTLPSPSGLKIHVVGQNIPKNAPASESHSIAPASQGEQENKFTRKQRRLSNIVATAFAEKGYTIVSANEADYVVYARLTHLGQGGRSKAFGEPYRNVRHQQYIGSYRPEERADGPAIPIYATYETNDWMDHPDMRIEPDNLSINIAIVRAARTQGTSPQTVWTGELFTKTETASPQRYIQTLLTYLWQDYQSQTRLASK